MQTDALRGAPHGARSVCWRSGHVPPLGTPELLRCGSVYCTCPAPRTRPGPGDTGQGHLWFSFRTWLSPAAPPSDLQQGAETPPPNIRRQFRARPAGMGGGNKRDFGAGPRAVQVTADGTWDVGHGADWGPRQRPPVGKGRPLNDPGHWFKHQERAHTSQT